MSKRCSRSRHSMTRLLLPFRRTLLGLVVLLGLSCVCAAYSVLTHEEVVDLLWNDTIQPLLLKRFPSATPDDLKKAHALRLRWLPGAGHGLLPFWQ